MSSSEVNSGEFPQASIHTRLKQIMFGKNTEGYQRYLMLIPKDKRKPSDPSTPDPYENTSKRRFEGKMRKWRRELHDFDPQTDEERKELSLYLQKLDSNLQLQVVTKQNEEEDEDMRLWDLL